MRILGERASRAEIGGTILSKMVRRAIESVRNTYPQVTFRAKVELLDHIQSDLKVWGADPHLLDKVDVEMGWNGPALRWVSGAIGEDDEITISLGKAIEERAREHVNQIYGDNTPIHFRLVSARSLPNPSEYDWLVLYVVTDDKSKEKERMLASKSIGFHSVRCVTAAGLDAFEKETGQ